MSDEQTTTECGNTRSPGERTPQEMVQKIQEFAAALAREVISMSQALPMLRGTPLWGEGVAIADTMASVAFTMGCITKMGCDVCDDEVKRNGAKVLMRWRGHIESVLSAGVAGPPPDAPIR